MSSFCLSICPYLCLSSPLPPSIPPLLYVPCFNEVVDGSVHLFLLDEVVSPGLLQFHHLSGEGYASQLHSYRKQEGETFLPEKLQFTWFSLNLPSKIVQNIVEVIKCYILSKLPNCFTFPEGTSFTVARQRSLVVPDLLIQISCLVRREDIHFTINCLSCHVGLRHIPAVNRRETWTRPPTPAANYQLSSHSYHCEARAPGKDPGKHREYLLLIIRRSELCDSANTTMEIQYLYI